MHITVWKVHMLCIYYRLWHVYGLLFWLMDEDLFVLIFIYLPIMTIHWIWLYRNLWQVSLVRQRTLTRPEHLVLPLLQCALMLERSTLYVLFTDFGTSMDSSFVQRIRIWSYWYLFKGMSTHLGHVMPKRNMSTRGPVGLYRSPGVQNFINKVLGFSHKRSSSMMENIWLIQGSSVPNKLFLHVLRRVNTQGQMWYLNENVAMNHFEALWRLVQKMLHMTSYVQLHISSAWPKWPQCTKALHLYR